MTNVENEQENATGKGRPTPSRKEAQARRAQPLLGSSAKPTKADKQRVMEARERARIGYAAGEDRYLPDRDKGPQRRFVRDFIDARTSFAEWMLPLMLIIVIMTFVANEVVQLVSIITIWGYLAVVVFDSTIMANRLKKQLAAKFGQGNVQSGSAWYGIMRSMQLRRLRLPKPQVSRGQFPR